MFKFLLKKRYKLLSEDNVIGDLSICISFAFMLSLKLIFDITFFENPFFEALTLMLILFLEFIINIAFFLIIKIFVNEYRFRNPSSITYINQNGKNIEIKDFPSLCRRQYYYNGVLHNEKNGAIKCTQSGEEQFYLFGKKYDFFDFKKIKNKIVVQEKITKF